MLCRIDHIKNLCKLLRYDILTSTTAAGSGHPSSCLSAVELMATLFFSEFFHFDLQNPSYIINDRVIFSKGHAAPLLYALYHAAGAISYDELMTLRTFDSRLEGHPTPRFPYIDVATGSLGQGLSMGLGMALGIKSQITNNKLHIKREPKVWVLLGDSELAEGQNWEAMESASYYKLNNLIGILDVNRLGQTDETMLGWDIKTYKKRIESFGWNVIVIEDGHDLKQVNKAFNKLIFYPPPSKPTMIIAKTVKGKGVSFLEDKNGWHGKTVPKERLQKALKELGKVDFKVRGKIYKPKIQNSEFRIQNKSTKLQKIINKLQSIQSNSIIYQQKNNSDSILNSELYILNSLYSTREAFGDALITLGKSNKKIVVFDAEMSNSTYENKFQKLIPERFYEMYIEEQNMISAALGISKMGFIPFVSTFASFLTRAYDQIRMAQYSNANIKIVGSHTGVVIGADGPSQMGLEDISMMKSILNSVVLCPSDAISTYTLTQKMVETPGIVYMRTLREKVPVIYSPNDKFIIGGSKIHKIVGVGHDRPLTLIIAAGVTVHEALKAQLQLSKQGINVVVLDCYSIKPIDVQSIELLTSKINNIIVVEDHYPTGGLGEAVLSALADNKFLINLISNYSKKIPIGNYLGQLEQLKIRSFVHLCVRKSPRSGTPQELLHYEEIDAEAITKAVKK